MGHWRPGGQSPTACLLVPSWQVDSLGFQWFSTTFTDFMLLKKILKKNYHHAIKKSILLLKTFGIKQSQNKLRFLIKHNIVLHFSHFTTDHRGEKTWKGMFCRPAFDK